MDSAKWWMNFLIFAKQKFPFSSGDTDSLVSCGGVSALEPSFRRGSSAKLIYTLGVYSYIQKKRSFKKILKVF